MDDMTTDEDQGEGVLHIGPTKESRSRKTRGGAPARGKKVTEVTKREYVQDPDDEKNDEDPELPGLFSTAEVEERSVARIRVIRKDPHEGMLGYIEDPSGSEQEIRDQWGGGLFRLEGLALDGKIVVARTIKLAGDPIFVSATAEAQWRKSRGLAPVGSAPTPTDTQGMSMQDMMMFWREQENDRRRSEEERRERQSRENREYEERVRKMELEAEARRRDEDREREERRRKESLELEERRRRDDNERDDRRRKEAAENEQRQQAFMQQTLLMTRQSAEQAIAFVKSTVPPPGAGGNAPLMDAIKTVVAIKEAFGGDGGGGEDEPDPLNLLIKHGPSWLEGLGGAVREMKAKPGEARALPSPQNGLPPYQTAGTGPGFAIPATSPLAPKLQTLVGKIVERGHDPEKILSLAVDEMISNIDGKASTPVQAPQQAGPVPTPMAQAPATPASAPSHQPPVVALRADAPPTKAQVSAQKTKRGSTRVSFG